MLAASFIAVSVLAAVISAQTPPNGGENVIATSRVAGMCLTAEGTENGASVDIQPCHELANQMWLFTAGTVNTFNGTKCLDVKDGSTADGAQVQLWDCTPGDTNQQWYYTTDERLAWTNHGKCLDLTDGNTAAGTRPQISTCTDGDENQVWDTAPLSDSQTATATMSFGNPCTTA